MPDTLQSSVEIDLPAVFVSEADVRRDADRCMDEAERGLPVVISREGGKDPLVLVTLHDYEGWKETVRLLQNPVGAARLLHSIRQADAGNVRQAPVELLQPAPDKA